MKSIESPIKKSDEINHFAHLEKGIQPIRACIMDRFLNHSSEEKNQLNLIKSGADFVDWHSNEFIFNKSSVREKGKTGEWVISYISETDKYSTDYWNCTGVVAVGTRKEDGKQVSLLTHQNPHQFLNDDQKFTEDLSGSLQELKNTCKPGTVDVVILGGNQDFSDDWYIRSISLVDKICKDSLGFTPDVITGPDFSNNGPAQAYFETQTRRLYFARPEQKHNDLNESFSAADVEEKMKSSLKWRGLI